MRVLLTGATGFVGSHLARHLRAAQHEIAVVSRGPSGDHDWSEAGLRAGVEWADAIVHLAGENIFAGRWSARRKEQLRSSRIETTERLARLAAEHGARCLVSASAVGYYGPRGDEPVAAVSSGCGAKAS